MNNKKDVWFEAAWYGYCPVSWQGFVISSVYAGAVAYWFSYFEAYSRFGSDALMGFAPVFIILSMGYLFICRNRVK